MTTADRTAPAERIRLNRESRHDSIVRWLDKMADTPAEQLRWIDDDREWFFVWSAALGVGATCPSNTTRQMVRDTIRTRLPELHVLSVEERDILEQLERARLAAGCSVCDEQAEAELRTAALDYATANAEYKRQWALHNEGARYLGELVCEGTGIEQDDDGRWPCTESKHDVES